jgi:Uncharacterized conserved protein
MDIIKQARELGKALQQEESFIAMQMAKQACDEDEKLQSDIGEFNLKKMAINMEVQKEDKNEETIQRLNTEFRQVYADILRNENMTKYNDAKTNFDAIYQQAIGIINLCTEGEDPDTCEYNPAACDGDCSGCSGCH